ncbi:MULTISPECIES: hypothetical protein [unclassified Haladaptatus]|uniref:hypothetical protein n=1 Tax=unclassified Haladaptatus TaxID=2622732 RepID=UPI00209C4595|nr:MULTISPECIES: hypothetical protein [unclassified Haladaptatus]MCO8245732.1 hypothetical protein [Haladaptatus sp. AB643]MCO8256077.1 hypothetical protein [Haladaptatus sp. AB618]
MCQHCAHGDDGWADLIKYDETYSAGLDGDSDSDRDDGDSDHDGDSDSDGDTDSDAHQSVRTTST